MKLSLFRDYVDRDLKNGSLFYFSYFGACFALNKEDDDARRYFDLILEYLKLVDFLNSENKPNSLVVAFKNPGKIVFDGIFATQEKFTNISPDDQDGSFLEISFDDFLFSLHVWSRKLVEECNFSCKIQIIFYKLLTNQDIIWAIDKSNNIVGCTGDDSFSKAISLGKFPFYYARSHKLSFRNNFCEFLSNCGLGLADEILTKFCRDNNHYSPKGFFELINKTNPNDLKKEISIFQAEAIEKIRTDYSIFDHLKSEIRRSAIKDSSQ